MLREILATPRRPENQHRKADRVPASHWPKHLTLLAGAGTIVLIVGLLIFNIWKPAENPGTCTISHSAPPTADYPWYATEDDLIAASDAILRGEVLDEREEQLDGLDYTVVTVKVDTVAEGPLKPDEQVDVKYPSLTEPVPVGLGPGDHVVLFLALFQAARHAVKGLSHHAKFILVAHLDRVIQIPLADAVNAGLQPLERVEDQHNQQMVDQ